MKKIKIALIAIAITGAVGVAYATRPCDACEYSQQYYRVGTSYYEAGIYGDTYICWNQPGTCTYYRPLGQPNTYLPCRSGIYETDGLTR